MSPIPPARPSAAIVGLAAAAEVGAQLALDSTLVSLAAFGSVVGLGVLGWNARKRRPTTPEQVTATEETQVTAPAQNEAADDAPSLLEANDRIQQELEASRKELAAVRDEMAERTRSLSERLSKELTVVRERSLALAAAEPKATHQTLIPYFARLEKQLSDLRATIGSEVEREQKLVDALERAKEASEAISARIDAQRTRLDEQVARLREHVDAAAAGARDANAELRAAWREAAQESSRAMSETLANWRERVDATTEARDRAANEGVSKLRASIESIHARIERAEGATARGIAQLGESSAGAMRESAEAVSARLDGHAARIVDDLSFIRTSLADLSLQAAASPSRGDEGAAKTWLASANRIEKRLADVERLIHDQARGVVPVAHDGEARRALEDALARATQRLLDAQAATLAATRAAESSGARAITAVDAAREAISEQLASASRRHELALSENALANGAAFDAIARDMADAKERDGDAVARIDAVARSIHDARDAALAARDTVATGIETLSARAEAQRASDDAAWRRAGRTLHETLSSLKALGAALDKAAEDARTRDEGTAAAARDLADRIARLQDETASGLARLPARIHEAESRLLSKLDGDTTRTDILAKLDASSATARSDAANVLAAVEQTQQALAAATARSQEALSRIEAHLHAPAPRVHLDDAMAAADAATSEAHARLDAMRAQSAQLAERIAAHTSQLERRLAPLDVLPRVAQSIDESRREEADARRSIESKLDAVQAAAAQAAAVATEAKAHAEARHRDAAKLLADAAAAASAASKVADEASTAVVAARDRLDAAVRESSARLEARLDVAHERISAVALDAADRAAAQVAERVKDAQPDPRRLAALESRLTDAKRASDATHAALNAHADESRVAADAVRARLGDALDALASLRAELPAKGLAEETHARLEQIEPLLRQLHEAGERESTRILDAVAASAASASASLDTLRQALPDKPTLEASHTRLVALEGAVRAARAARAASARRMIEVARATEERVRALDERVEAHAVPVVDAVRASAATIHDALSDLAHDAEARHGALGKAIANAQEAAAARFDTLDALASAASMPAVLAIDDACSDLGAKLIASESRVLAAIEPLAGAVHEATQDVAHASERRFGALDALVRETRAGLEGRLVGALEHAAARNSEALRALRADLPDKRLFDAMHSRLDAIDGHIDETSRPVLALLEQARADAARHAASLLDRRAAEEWNARLEGRIAALSADLGETRAGLERALVATRDDLRVAMPDDSAHFARVDDKLERIHNRLDTARDETMSEVGALRVALDDARAHLAAKYDESVARASAAPVDLSPVLAGLAALDESIPRAAEAHARALADAHARIEHALANATESRDAALSRIEARIPDAPDLGPVLAAIAKVDAGLPRVAEQQARALAEAQAGLMERIERAHAEAARARSEGFARIEARIPAATDLSPLAEKLDDVASHLPHAFDVQRKALADAEERIVSSLHDVGARIPACPDLAPVHEKLEMIAGQLPRAAKDQTRAITDAETRLAASLRRIEERIPASADLAPVLERLDAIAEHAPRAADLHARAVEDAQTRMAANVREILKRIPAAADLAPVLSKLDDLAHHAPRAAEEHTRALAEAEERIMGSLHQISERIPRADFARLLAAVDQMRAEGPRALADAEARILAAIPPGAPAFDASPFLAAIDAWRDEATRAHDRALAEAEQRIVAAVAEARPVIPAPDLAPIAARVEESERAVMARLDALADARERARAQEDRVERRAVALEDRLARIEERLIEMLDRPDPAKDAAMKLESRLAALERRLDAGLSELREDVVGTIAVWSEPASAAPLHDSAIAALAATLDASTPASARAAAEMDSIDARLAEMERAVQRALQQRKDGQ